MSDKTDFSHTRTPAFWQGIYDANDTKWDLGGATPDLLHALQLGLLHEHRSVLVPGCGNGHDAVAIAAAGNDVVAVDFAQDAVQTTANAAAQAGVVLEARQANIFDLFEAPAGSFDAVYEYTCYCAIDPAERDRYAELMAHLLRDGGRLLMLAFPLDREKPGPPHRITMNELRQRFDKGWRWCFDAPSRVGPEGRRDRQRIVLLERQRA